MAAASSFINNVSSWPPATALRLEFKHVDGSIKYAYKFLVGFRGLSSWVVFQRHASGKFLHDDFGVSLSLQVFVSIAAPLQSQLVSNALLCVLACVSAVLCAPHVRLHLRYSWAWEAWSDGKTVTLADAACDNSSSQVCLTLDETEGIVFQVAEKAMHDSWSWLVSSVAVSRLRVLPPVSFEEARDPVPRFHVSDEAFGQSASIFWPPPPDVDATKSGSSSSKRAADSPDSMEEVVRLLRAQAAASLESHLFESLADGGNEEDVEAPLEDSLVDMLKRQKGLGKNTQKGHSG